MDKVTRRSTTKGNISLTHCQFVNNTAGGSGGAMYKMYKTGSNDSIMVDDNAPVNVIPQYPLCGDTGGFDKYSNQISHHRGNLFGSNPC